VSGRTSASADLKSAEVRPTLEKEGMTLRDLLAGLEIPAPAVVSAVRIDSVACDSRQVGPGSCFVAIHGGKADGNRFVFDAAERGAHAIVSELPRPPHPEWAALGEELAARTLPAEVVWVRVPNARRALAVIAANFYGRPADALTLVGITGTNGKTTTNYLVDSLLRAAGHRSAMLGTVEYRLPGGEKQKATHTTPESLELQRFFAEARRAGGTHVAFEVSSHALAMERVWGCGFDVAVFTNLQRDHLDFHGSFEEYFAAKRRLFEGTGRGAPRIAVLNHDDAHAHELAGLAQQTLSFGLDAGAQVTTKDVELSFSGLHFTARTPAGPVEIHSPLVGRINVYNILAAVAVGIAMGFDRATIERGIAQLASVPGRFQRVDCGQPFLVVIDYAHTPEAYQNLIQTARELNPSGRILMVFGCGGDRDRTKRPLMGETAGRLADLVILTDDNPRTEDPLRIINDVVVGLQKTRVEYRIQPDRERGIELALDEARPGDIVLLAGKGHETYQILRDRTLDFSEREIVRRVLAERGYRSAG
jgi:UDP-N-acetylmuramoyl-L-alanyl-D-glutamate--2,6-diaminopimelate ligase